MNAPNAFTGQNNSTILYRVATGDSFAFEECVKTYKNIVWKIARKYAKTNQDAEDIVQEIFLSIWKNAARFDAEKSPESAFICLIAQRKSIDLLRRNRSQFSEIELSESDEPESAKNLKYQNVFLNLDLQKVKRAFNDLSFTENKLLRLSVYEGNSHTEIAGLIGMPLGTVKSKIRRGLGKVRTSVGKPFLADLYKAYYG